MIKAFAVGFRQLMIISTTLLVIGINTRVGFAENKLYNPIPLTLSTEVSDTLSDKDIPTGQGGFGRDYTVKLNKGDKLVIDLTSESFDTIITLLAPNGATVAENDDGPDGTSNSLLFTRINETGGYIIRVRSFGETGVGPFKLNVTKLQVVK
ncbi:PPC domain-containing protein [Umezakia ovalisporum]|uniref:PPC domain-containing protein n=2 Tax=Umezakia ovalisporum TaxID=75695 RepID=A0AA43GW70_9CYAN|nr:PPC domain-containing protein [Umezakia ovalisporum]MBI1241999.1 peptidase [Nostoc sp. RI_552]MDH6056808.1 PPC domain-containing protein [Umezakia ovalisporum FSS-43]MDH6062739.1 PPC domain-containing protein [Umezakia ovalisporum FSS-62]MDH6068182.1 PPC domain-containing protein [Umezakia ovalisporum APH033B]MDH6072223.1 PPC domain-containing protein [Umezakia ovalisporum CobakiLakeA]